MPLEPGICLGPYEITAAIGAGGMGEVYKARDHRLERDVAVKVLPTHFKPGTRQLEQFEHEARLLASLNHPSICGIYDVGSERGVSFIVMEHLQGETLAARIERGPVPVNVALHYALQIAEALRAAHGAGLVHRDIKPGNIMLTTMGVKLLDFGLAKRHMAAPASPKSVAPTGSVDTARMEGIVGTLHYMPPEQLAGGVVDARSDIWAFGCVIYEMVAGRRAFNGKTMTEVIAAIVTDRPAVMTIEHGVAPLALEHFVSRCLARNPDERWPSVGDLMGELRSMLPHANQASASGPAVNLSPGTAATAHAASSAGYPSASSSSSPSLLPDATPRPRRKLTVTVVAVLAAGAAAWFARSAFVSRQRPVVAILPFVNSGGSADLDDLTEGLPDGVVDALRLGQRVRAVPPSVAFHQASSDPARAGQAVGADRVVTGRLQLRSGRLEVDATLLEVASGSAVWSEHFSAPLNEVAALQRDLDAGILKALGADTVTEGSTASEMPSRLSGDTYRLLVKGRYAASRGDERSLRNALGFFTNATVKDPTLAHAFAGIAACYSELVHFRLAAARPSEALPRVKAAATKALELDPLLADAHVALGFVKAMQDRDWAGAGAEYNRAVELEPYDPASRQRRSEWLMAVGRSDEALAEARGAARLDPKSSSANLNLGWQLFLARQYPEAIAQLQATITSAPDLAAARSALGMTYAETGKLDDALREMKAVKEGSASRLIHQAGLAYVNAKGHRMADAAQQLARLRANAASDYVSPYDLALIALALDDYPQALELLRRAVDEHASAVAMLPVDPRLDVLRSDTRFKDLVKRAGL